MTVEPAEECRRSSGPGEAEKKTTPEGEAK